MAQDFITKCVHHQLTHQVLKRYRQEHAHREPLATLSDRSPSVFSLKTLSGGATGIEARKATPTRIPGSRKTWIALCFLSISVNIILWFHIIGLRDAELMKNYIESAF